MASLVRGVIRAGTIRPLAVRYLNDNAAKLQPKINATKTTNTDVSTNQPQNLNLSDSCVKRLQEVCKDGSFLRLTVEGGGCSGFQYKFDLDTKLNEDDICFGPDEAKVVTDAVSIEYCNGATIDFHTELIRSGFRVMGNPKAEQGCSCGASFAIRLD